MLYYFGYLTIKGEVEDTDDILFTIPNRAMEFVFNDYFVNILNKNKIEINTQTKVDIAKCLNNGSIESLNKYASIILKEIDNELFKGFNERDIEIIYFTLMKGVTSYNTYTEHQANGGHIDLYIKGKKPLSYNYIIEFKHIKKNLYTDKLLEEKINQAKDQLIRYSKDSRISKKS